MLEPPAVPGVGQAFDDEGRGVAVELVDMRPDPAMFGLFEDKVKASSNFCWVPSQTNLQRLTSMSGRNTS